MMERIVDFFLGCAHPRCTFPLTVRANRTRRARTYICCLSCGAEFDYSWREMRVIHPARVAGTLEVACESK